MKCTGKRNLSDVLDSCERKMTRLESVIEELLGVIRETRDIVTGTVFCGSVEDYLSSIGKTITTSNNTTLREPLPSEA